MRPSVDHQSVEIESFQDSEGSGGRILLRPLVGQKFSADLRLEGNRSLTVDYPVGTRFKVQAALTNRPGGDYLYTHWQWDMKVLSRPDDVAA